MRNILGVVALILFVSGCDAKSVEIDTDPSQTTYSRDTRTGLCFASLGRAGKMAMSDMADSFSVTSVPCSPEVLRLVPEDQKE